VSRWEVAQNPAPMAQPWKRGEGNGGKEGGGGIGERCHKKTVEFS